MDAESGGPGEAFVRSPRALTPVKVDVERINKEIVLRFVTVEHFPEHLYGVLRGRSNVGPEAR